MATKALSDWALPQEKIITPEDVKRILEAAKESDQRDYVFFAITANTGLRLCEVAHLTKDDVLETKLIVVRRKKRVLQPTTIDVVPALHQVIKSWAVTIDEGYLFAGGCSPCFVKRSSGAVEQVCVGGHVSLRCIQRRWDALLQGLGIRVPGRGIHSTRHFAITQFYKRHRDLRAAQLFAAHSSSGMTERYAHCVDMQEKIEAMEAAL